MGHPTKIWRKWTRKVNLTQRRAAIASAVAASGQASLVLAKGHTVDEVQELPCVVDVADVQLKKTKEAVALLKRLGAWDDCVKAKESKRIRAGKGKTRNRRYKAKKGPLVVYKEGGDFVLALRNLPGVDVVHISALNVCKLAPGGHMGRLVIWTKSAFECLDSIFGGVSSVSSRLHNQRT